MNIELSKEEELLFQKISEVAIDLNIEAYVIGGFVRDKILKRTSKDIDLVCIGNGIEFAEAVAKKLLRENDIHVFKNFGTAQLIYNEFEIEFVGARKESYRSESRNPDVEIGSRQDDLNRRDFTINTLSMSLNKENFGVLLDDFNGLQDIENKKIITPLDPDTTFSDDPLRMMRAIRFASQLQFDIDNNCFEAIKQNAERIKIISQERITEELNKIILSAKPSIGFNLLDESGLLEIIFPEFIELKGAEFIEGKGHKDNFYHTLEVLDNTCLVSENLWLRWAAILHDIAKPATKKFDSKTGWTFHGHEWLGAKMVPKIFKKLKLPTNEKMHFVKKLVLLHLRPISLTKENITDSALRRLLFDAGDDLEALLLLCNADITSKNPEKVKRFKSNFEMVKLQLIAVEEKDHIRNWQPPISGELIMETFDLTPCKKVGDIKEAIREAILDNKIENNYKAAFQFMLELGNEMGLRKV